MVKRFQSLKNKDEYSNLEVSIYQIPFTYQTKNKSPQDPLNYPIRLNNKYGHVIVLATIGFDRPTTSMVEVEKELSNLIDKEISRWEETKTSLKELDKKMRSAEVPFIKW